MSDIRVVEIRGSHLLIAREGRFAVVERRNGRLYGTGGGDRRAHPETPTGMAAAGDETGWTDEAGARQSLAAIAERGDELARKIW
jgi:hypothetical protein